MQRAGFMVVGAEERRLDRGEGRVPRSNGERTGGGGGGSAGLTGLPGTCLFRRALHPELVRGGTEFLELAPGVQPRG